MAFRSVLIATTALCALPFAALAEDNWYLGLGAGATFQHDADATLPNGARSEIELDWGWEGEAALGYDFDNGFRTEVEVAYRAKNDVDNISGALNPSGDTSSFSGMFNVLYDFDLMDDSRFVPYLGVGAGIMHVDYDQTGPVVGLGTVMDDTDTAFGYQGIAGLTFKANDNIHLYADYKYTSAYEAEFDSIAASDIKADYDVSTISAGIRINFGADTAPMPVAAAPAPMPAPEPRSVSRTYIVFFDFDKADISPEAREVLGQAAADARSGNAISIEVRGHADRSGSDQYNMELSQRRAEAVKGELARNGLPVDNIATSAHGEREPLVPTADGIKEPQNRRAEVTYTRPE